jgi:hypothetical protein
MPNITSYLGIFVENNLHSIKRQQTIKNANNYE